MILKLDPEELEEAHAAARKKIIEAAAMGNNAGMQAYAIMLLADAVMFHQPVVTNQVGDVMQTLYRGAAGLDPSLFGAGPDAASGAKD